MADDALGLRGFAVTLPRSGGGNLYALANLAQRKQQQDREFQYKEQQDALKTHDELNKGLYTSKLNPALQEAQQQSLIRTKEAMDSARKQALKSGDWSGLSQADYQLKGSHDTFAQGLESMQGEISKIQEVISKDSDKVFNPEVVGRKINGVTTGALIKEGNQVVGIDFEKAADLNKFFEDPDLYNDAALNKKYISQLGEIALDNQTDSFGSTNKQTATNLFQIKDGKIQKDPNTGKPIPAATPEAIELYDADPIRKQKLDKYAQSITTDGNWEKNRGKAFKRFIVEPFASYKEDKQIKQAPEAAAGRAQKEADANTRYQTLRSIVDSHDESALAQGFNVNDRIKAEFKGGGSKGNLPGETKPDQIVIYKREQLPVDPLDPTAVKYSDWLPVDYMPIRTDDQKDVAIFKMNSLQDEAQEKSGFVVGQEAIRRIHNEYKKKSNEADKYKLN